MLRRTHHQHGNLLATFGLAICILIFMVLIAIPVVRHARADNHARACIDTLATILAAKERYVLANDVKRGGKVEFKDLLTDKTPLLKQMPLCPDGGKYSINPEGEYPSCSMAGHELPMVAQRKLKLAAEAAATTETTRK